MRPQQPTSSRGTHYLDEAQRLADRVAIIAAGRIVAEGTPAITFRLPEGWTPASSRPISAPTSRCTASGSSFARTSRFHSSSRSPSGRGTRGIDLPELEVRQRSLEDIYLELAAAE
jgi:ABC-2 type transport system ATP-binding protein